MSPSWIERARGWMAPRASAGLSIGRDYAGMAELARTETGWRVRELAESRLAISFFAGQPTPAASVALADALGNIAVSLRNRYIPVHVSLPDAAVRLAVFELDDLPEKRSAQMELARWRLGQDGGAGAGLEVCACQPLGADGAKQLLLALAMDQAWHACLSAALSKAGIVAWSMSSNSCRQFNRFHDRIAVEGGALVTVTQDAWALWLWDAAGRPRYARARWHSAGDDPVAIAAEIERSILAYVHGAPSRAVMRAYVTSGEAQSAIAAALNARLHDPSVGLPSDDGLIFESGANRAATSAAAALAAALAS